MSVIRLLRSLPPLAAVTAVLLTALPALAQTPRIPPDARGYQTTMLIQEAHRYTAPAPVSPAPTVYRAPATGLSVDVNVPNVTVPVSAPTKYVTLRGPNGEVRRFALARGVEVQYVRRHIVLRPGESTTVRLTPVP
jgi:hypothetical protein